jgi:hypothetical protein
MKDLILDDNYDLDIKNGDFVMGDSTFQNQKLLFETTKGEWKQNPAVGIGAEDYVADDELVEFENEIRRQFVADGMDIAILQVLEDGSVNVKANYGTEN